MGATWLTASGLVGPLSAAILAAAMLSLVPSGALAQDVAKPAPHFDPSQLPPLPPVVPVEQRQRTLVVSEGAGAVFGVLLVDFVSGGLLLTPLGVPSAATLFSAASPAIVQPAYTVTQQALAGLATFAAAMGGGYVGSYFGRARPDLVGLPQ
jgi:hypothetical protein